jgi:LacI family transcriptional regulator
LDPLGHRRTDSAVGSKPTLRALPAPVTIEHIAQKAGVSTSTVARVLRGDVKGAQQRSAKNAREILRISEELGYRPNWTARALSRGKTHTIGLLYSNAKWIFEDPMNELAISFTDTLKQHSYDLRLIPADSPDNWQETVLGGAVDGLVMMQHTPPGGREAIVKSRLPTVLLGDKQDLGLPQVYPDDVGGAYIATRHLLLLGHKRILFYIDETIREHHSVGERCEGFRKAMLEAGLTEASEVVRSTTQTVMDRLLGPEPPTAVIGYCHVEALKVLQAAWTVGLAVPTDFSLIGFNDTWITQCLTPPLTVVGFDPSAMGRHGAEVLVRMIENPTEARPQDVVVPERLIIRGTTAPPASR